MNKKLDIKRQNIEEVIFYDIETVGDDKLFGNLNDDLRHFLYKRCKEDNTELNLLNDEELLIKYGGLYPEVGKIACFSFGKFKDNKFYTSSYADEDEKIILNKIDNLLSSPKNLGCIMCGHNNISFDLPFIAKRFIINRMELPLELDYRQKQVWDIMQWDTMRIWNYGNLGDKIALKELAAIFNIPTPKDDIEGKDVAEVYYKEKNIQRIVEYCEKDVTTTAKIFQILKS